MWTWASEGCEAPAQWPVCCVAGAEQAREHGTRLPLDWPEKRPDSRARCAGPSPWGPGLSCAHVLGAE